MLFFWYGEGGREGVDVFSMRRCRLVSCTYESIPVQCLSSVLLVVYSGWKALQRSSRGLI